MTNVVGSNARAGTRASNITAPTQFVETGLETYAYRRFGRGAAPPLVFLQHFTGNLDNWDPAVTDALAEGREVILFESAGLGRSTGEVPDTIQGMTAHFLAFADALRLTQVDLLGFSLGGMVAQQAALERPSLVRKLLLVGTAPEGGEDIMHLEKPELSRILQDPTLKGYQVLVKLFFTPERVESGGGPGVRVEAHAARGGPRAPVRAEGRPGPDRGVSRVGTGGRRAVRQAPQDHPAEPGGEWRHRQHDSRQKLLRAGRAPAASDAVDVSRCWPWLAVSVP